MLRFSCPAGPFSLAYLLVQPLQGLGHGAVLLVLEVGLVARGGGNVRHKALAHKVVAIGGIVVLGADVGGELPAMTVTDAVARMIPGVLGAAAGAADDSFYSSLLEYPQYTKPAVFRGMAVPEVLRNGDHAKIDAWRREASLARTLELRPDLLQHCDLSPADQKILAKLKGAKKG